jgi:hypothetical protein
MNSSSNKPFLGQLATTLSYVYKIVRIGFDFYRLIHFGH